MSCRPEPKHAEAKNLVMTSTHVKQIDLQREGEGEHER
jgi:hypothetical protein